MASCCQHCCKMNFVHVRTNGRRRQWRQRDMKLIASVADSDRAIPWITTPLCAAKERRLISDHTELNTNIETSSTTGTNVLRAVVFTVCLVEFHSWCWRHCHLEWNVLSVFEVVLIFGWLIERNKIGVVILSAVFIDIFVKTNDHQR